MGWIATGLCIPAFLVPYSFVFYPELLMKGEAMSILWTTFSACMGILFVAGGAFGFFLKPTSIPERFLFIAGGLLLFDPVFLPTYLAVSWRPWVCSARGFDRQGQNLLPRRDSNHRSSVSLS